jgi:hypothetical protein
MWKLRGRDNKLSDGPSMANFGTSSIQRSAFLNWQDPNGSLFFRVQVDPTPLTAITGISDTEIFSRLEYQSEEGFYLLERSVS